MGAGWIRGALLLCAGMLAMCAGPTARPAWAQVPAEIQVGETVWRIDLVDGSRLIGEVVALSPQRVTVRTSGGVTVELDRAQIRSMSRARGTVRNGVLWPEDPNRTRLFFGPTGRMLDRGEGYVSVFELVLPFASYGITDYFTMAGGTPIVPRAIGRVWYFAPKVGAAVGPRTSISGGVLAFQDIDVDWVEDLRSFGVLYAVGTHGTADHAGTFAAGWGFAGTEVTNRPVFMLGGESRVSPRVKLLSENYIITYRERTMTGERNRVDTLFSGGVRLFGERLSADAGVGIYYSHGNTTFGVPLVNFVYNFGGPR